MSVSVQQILGFLRAVAPQELALDWDNVGLLVDAGQPVDGVLTTLDITPPSCGRLSKTTASLLSAITRSSSIRSGCWLPMMCPPC